MSTDFILGQNITCLCVLTVLTVVIYVFGSGQRRPLLLLGGTLLALAAIGMRIMMIGQAAEVPSYRISAMGMVSVILAVLSLAAVTGSFFIRRERLTLSVNWITLLVALSPVWLSGLLCVLIHDVSGTLTNDVVRAALGPYNIDEIKIGTINIGSGITAIGFSAFEIFRGKGMVAGNTTLNIGDSVQTIGERAFYQNYDIAYLNIGSGVTTIGTEAFRDCSAVTSITIPDSVISISNTAFSDCISATSLSIGSGVTSIGTSAFWGCEKITTVTIPSSVKSIGDNAFNQDEKIPIKLTDITFETTSLRSCGRLVWPNRSLYNIHLPCEHFNVGGEVVTEANKEKYFGSDAKLFIPPLSTELANIKEATCTEEGNTGDTVCTVCGLVLNEGTAIQALGHDWDEWTVTTPATCEGKGEETHICKHDASHKETREIPALGHDWGEWTGDPVQTSICKNDENHKQYRRNPAIQFAATAGNNSQYILGSKKTLGLTIDRVDREDENVYAYFNNGGQVVVTGSNDYSKTLKADDFDAESGSLKITLKTAYLEGLAPGTYSLTASFKVADGYDPIVSEPALFTVAPSSSGSTPASSTVYDSPGTGESNMMTTFSVAFMLIAAYGAVYAVKRRKTEQA